MPVTQSPLRYPGGKTQLFKFVRNLIEINEIKHSTYIEPFAGGAGVALELLFSNSVENIVINDYDKSIHSVWYAIINHTDEFIRLIETVPITIDEWHRQRSIYLDKKNSMNSVEGGFATFYLNRTNVSGIINGGPIGGKAQNGKYKLDCRYNKSGLIKKIKKIADYKSRITLYRKDANNLIDLILERYNSNNCFVFFDPPYYVQGQNLYLSFILKSEHQKMKNSIDKLNDYYWITTYDKSPHIADVYNDTEQKFEYNLNYSANKRKIATEYLFASKKTKIESFDKVNLLRI